MNSVKKYLSLIKFSHTIFALPFAVIGFCIAAKQPIYNWLAANFSNSLPPVQPVQLNTSANPYQLTIFQLFLLVVLCMVFARSAAMAFNRYLDKNFDAKNPRTAIREIPSGLIKANHALLFTIVNCMLFILCCWFINQLCFYLSFVALFVILFYSYTKRFTALCHLVLGVGLSLAPIGAYLAVTGTFDVLPVLFSFTVLCWVSGFDIIYALQDEAFDKQHNLHSIPAAVGKAKALRISELLHVFAAIFVIVAGIYGEFGWWYWTGVAVFCGMLVYQHSIVKPTDLHRVNIAFMTANGIASVVFALFVLLDLFIIK